MKALLKKIQNELNDVSTPEAKEAALKFEFVKDTNNTFKIVTYNNRGKDAEWTKTH